MSDIEPRSRVVRWPSLELGCPLGGLIMPAAKDYYEVLGVARNASAEQIKVAYRALAKAFHPDGNLGGADPARFSRVTEAYETLGNPDRRVKYDTSFYETPTSEERPKRLEPICCSHCGKVTAQPRYVVFWTVISIVIVTWRTPIQGIFCSGCARKVALRCSAISAFAGWWGFWGLIWTPVKILTNAGGGDQTPGSAVRLLWYNALAFWSQGKVATAHALAKMVAKSNTDMAIDAAKMVADLQRAGIPADSPGFADAWRSTFSHKLLHFGLLFAVPLVVAALIMQDGTAFSDRNYNNISSINSTDNAFSSSDPPRAPPVSSAQPDPVPTCDHEIESGAILGGELSDEDFGHRIEVKNGSSGPAIIKMRDAQSGRLQIAFYVGKAGQADVGPLPDGNYRIQYAIGEALAANCKSFTHLSGASEFPDTEAVAVEEVGGRRMAQRLSYTLYAVPSGNVRPQEIDLGAFEAD